MNGIIGELSQSIIAWAQPFLRDRNVGPDVSILDAFEILGGSIRRIAGYLCGSDVPAKEDATCGGRAWADCPSLRQAPPGSP